MVDKLSTAFHQSIQPTNTKLLTVTGEITPFLGKSNIHMKIGSQNINHQVLLADIENEGILGMDFLKTHKCDLMLSSHIMKLNKEEILCFQSSTNATPRCCRISVLDHIEIPPDTEVVVPAYVRGVIDRKGSGVIEADSKFLQTKGLLVAKALVCPLTGTVPVRIANPYEHSYKLYKNTIVASYEPIEPEQIVSVNCSRANENISETCSQTEIPDHLTDLYERSITCLDTEQQVHLRELLIKYQHIFSKDSHDLGRTSLVKHEIKLLPDTEPIKQHPYRLPLAKRQEVQDEIKAMAEKDLIEPSTSPWSSPVIAVPKKKGGIRICIDYRKLNQVTIPDSQPLPRCQDCLDALGGSKWFSTMDLRSGFHQLEIHESSRPYTAFCIPGHGLWQFKVVPQGAMNSPAVFERLMEKVFTGLTYITLLIYLDDIIVYGKTFEAHLQNLEEALKRLSDANLKLSPEKTVFFQLQVSFLGHLVSESGVSLDPQKQKSVQEWPVPTKVTEVRSFVGLCSYMRRFIRGFSMICKPLHELTQKGVKFVWSDECQVAFDTLKKLLTTAPVLAFPSEAQGEFIVDCDCSQEALGAVLSQIQEGEERVISYYSKCLSKTERRYCTTRRELLAVISSVKHFHPYLYGRHFTVRSDHGSLRWLMNNFSICEGQLARWIETLATYDFTIQYRPGVAHRNADAMSRRPCVDDNCVHCERYEKKYNVAVTGLATRTDGVDILDSTQIDGSIQKDSLLRVAEIILEGQVPTDNGQWRSKCSVEAPTSELSSAKELECTMKVNFENGTIPKINYPLHRSQQFCSDPIEQLSVTRTESLCCEPTRRVHNQTRGEQPMQRIDIESLNYSEGEESSELSNEDMQMELGNTEAAAIRNVETVNIDCFTPENIILEQDKHPEISLIKQWKLEDKKPEWSEIAKFGLELKSYWIIWDSLILKDDLLYRAKMIADSEEPRYQIVLPQSLRKKSFSLLHNTVTAGHLGVQKTLGKIKQRFFWYNLKNDIEHWCRVCDICASRKQPYRKVKAPMKQYNVGYPLERVAIDIMGPLPVTDTTNARFLLLVSCYFTKWLDAIPITSIDAKTVASKLIERFISVFGVPTFLHNDQGSNFESLVFKEVCNILGIQKTRTTPGRPQSDGMVERACRSVQGMLAAYVSENQRDWDVYIPLVMMAYRSSVHETTKCTPCSMMLGREIRLPIDLALGIPETTESKRETDYAYELEKHMIKIHDVARKHIQISSDGMKYHYDKKKHFNEYSVGDAVWFHNPIRKKSVTLKLQRAWKGPYVVTGKFSDVVYKIQESPKSKPKVVHHDRLKPYCGENTPTWFKMQD